MAKRKRSQSSASADLGGNGQLLSTQSAKKRKQVCSLTSQSIKSSTGREQQSSSSQRSSSSRENGSPLLRLLAELRNNIYRYTLLDPEEIEVERQQHV